MKEEKKDVHDDAFWGTMVSSRISGMVSSFAMAVPFSAPILSSSWQYIEGPDSPRETACRVIAGYSIWKPEPFVPMNARTLEISKNKNKLKRRFRCFIITAPTWLRRIVFPAPHLCSRSPREAGQARWRHFPPCVG